MRGRAARVEGEVKVRGEVREECRCSYLLLIWWEDAGVMPIGDENCGQRRRRLVDEDGVGVRGDPAVVHVVAHLNVDVVRKAILQLDLLGNHLEDACGHVAQR